MNTETPTKQDIRSAAALAAASEIIDWDNLSMPTKGDLAEIIDRHRAVTAEDAKTYLSMRFGELRSVTEGYITMNLEVAQMKSGSDLRIKFRAYAAEAPLSAEGATPDEVIRSIGNQIRGIDPEAKSLRQQAADLIKRAEQLESKSQPNG